MSLFKITYTDPDTQEEIVVEKEFNDTPPMGIIPGYNSVNLPNGISAQEWAEDWAYEMADKGPHTVTQIKSRS